MPAVFNTLPPAELAKDIAAHSKGSIAVLYGGESSEREVSLKSGEAVINAFAELGVAVEPIDVALKDLQQCLSSKNIKHCFIALHGGAGEDGTIQALLESMDVTYTGSSMLGCAIAMDKARTKLLWQGAGIATANFMTVDENTPWLDVSEKLGSKFMMKPANEGSSIGMSVVENEADYQQALKLASQYEGDVIAERWIDGPEYTVAIVDGIALPMVRMKTDNQFYDYQAKYESNSTQYICPCGLSAELELQIQQDALQAFELLACSGWGRIDVMLDADGQYYFLEANTVPGMTSHSLVPMAAKAGGRDFSALVGDILLMSLQQE